MKELALQNCRLDKRYDILRLLGRGSYAEIYLAKDTLAAPESNNELVVIKALNVFLQEHPDADLERTLVENFQNEALALDLVRHPNIISRLGHGTARDLRGMIFHYLVLEYLPGGDLSELCRTEQLSFDKTLFFLEQVCAGLEHAHEKGVIHRDIKPQNVLLTQDRLVAKIADFGVARFTNIDSPITRVGTNVYAAPEHSPFLATGDLTNVGLNNRLTPAADVYSLAKMVYTLLSGESPRRFANVPISELPRQIKNEVWADDVSLVLEKATQHNPEARFQTVTEFCQQLIAVKREISGDLPTYVARREAAATASLSGFTPKAPKRPEFDSMGNVQTAAIVAEELPERPRVVIELQKKRQQAQFAPDKPKAAPLPLEDYERGNGNLANVHVSQSPAGKQTDEELSSVSISHDAAKPYKRAGFFKRVLVSLILLSMFSIVLYGTYNYFLGQPLIPNISIFATTQKATVNTNANIRSSPAMGNNQIGIVYKDSELKILNTNGNWYEVEVIKQAQPDKGVANGTRGWVGKSIVDLQ